MNKTFTIALIIISQSICLAQVSNDDCATAMDYGVFPSQVQPPCPNGAAPYIGDNNDLTNVTPSSPYYFMTGCQGYTSTTTSFADDIWYKYRGLSGSTKVMLFGMDTLHVNFYNGTNCSNLQPSACFTYIPAYNDTLINIYSNNDTTNYYNYMQISSNVSGKQFWYFVCIDQPQFPFSSPAYGTIHFNNSVSIEETFQNDLIKIFPNPTADKLNVKINNNEKTSISVYDITSRKLLQQTFIHSISINTDQLAKGIYLYELRDKNCLLKKGKFMKD